MTKQFLRSAVFIFISVSIFISCKKTHSLHSYPSNVRVSSFSKTSTNSSTPLTVYEMYSFDYDAFNRVHSVLHSKNDGSANTISTFTYSNDTIYDTTRYVNQATIVETDIYLTDQKGLISATYEPGMTTTYEYAGKLVSHKSTSTGDNYSYTSYNLNLLKATHSTVPAQNQDYTYYTDKFNRPGDFLQLQGFMKYGFNFYQNDNLIRKIIRPFTTINLDYVIDADNKIIKTTAVTVDTAARSNTEVYDLQYQTY